MISQEELKEILTYDPDTGIFIRLKKTGCKGQIGARVGWVTKGYRYIRINNITYLAHRLA